MARSDEITMLLYEASKTTGEDQNLIDQYRKEIQKFIDTGKEATEDPHNKVVALAKEWLLKTFPTKDDLKKFKESFAAVDFPTHMKFGYKKCVERISSDIAGKASAVWGLPRGSKEKW
jgi:hypothetical protein